MNQMEKCQCESCIHCSYHWVWTSFTKNKCGREESYPQTSTILAENLGDFLGASLENCWFPASLLVSLGKIEMYQVLRMKMIISKTNEWIPGLVMTVMTNKKRTGKWPSRNSVDLPSRKIRWFSDFPVRDLGQFTRPGIPTKIPMDFPINSHLKPPYI